MTDRAVKAKLRSLLRAAQKTGGDGTIWLDLFSGSSVIGSKLRSRTRLSGISFDVSHGEWFDLGRRVVINTDVGWIRTGFVAALWCACPCSTWSIARRPMISSQQELLGMASALADVNLCRLLEAGNATMKASVEVAHACLRARIPSIFENPHSSLAWKTKAWQALAEMSDVQQVVLDQCRFGTPWRKRTRLQLLHVSNPGLLDRRCAGARGQCSATNRPHVQIIGSAMSRRAAAYPQKLAVAGAAVLADSVERKKLAGFFRHV